MTTVFTGAKNPSYVFCLEEMSQVPLPTQRTAVTVALCISTVPFTSQFKKKKKRCLMQLLQCHISLTLSLFEENFAHFLESLNSFGFGNPA